MAKGQLYRVPGYAAALGVYRNLKPRKASARYCFSVWLRHLAAAHENGTAWHSAHRELLTECHFDIVVEVRERAESEVERSELAPRFHKLPDDDLTTATGLFQAIRR